MYAVLERAQWDGGRGSIAKGVGRPSRRGSLMSLARAAATASTKYPKTPHWDLSSVEMAFISVPLESS